MIGVLIGALLGRHLGRQLGLAVEQEIARQVAAQQAPRDAQPPTIAAAEYYANNDTQVGPVLNTPPDWGFVKRMGEW